MKRELPDELKFLTNRKLPQKPFAASMAGRTCLITGATSGVGLAAARALAEKGASLVLISRNPVKAEQVKQEIQAENPVRIEAITADFSDLQQVREAAQAVIRLERRLDVLVNCAGMHATRRQLTADGFEQVFCVNHLASFLLTCLLLDKLISEAPARIIQVNSEGHRFKGLDPDDLNWQKRHYTGLRAYGASKTAQLLTVWELAERLQGTDVTINAMHPGDVKSNIGQNNGPLYRFFKRHVTDLFLEDAAVSGSAIGYLASAPELETVSGRFFHLTNEEKPAVHALDRALGKRIWQLSREMTGLS